MCVNLRSSHFSMIEIPYCFVFSHNLLRRSQDVPISPLAKRVAELFHPQSPSASPEKRPSSPRTLPMCASSWSMISRRTRAEFCKPMRSFGVSSNSIRRALCHSPRPSAPTSTHRANVQALLQRTHRQHTAIVQRQGVNHFADRQADAETGTALELDERCAGGLRFLEGVALESLN